MPFVYYVNAANNLTTRQRDLYFKSEKKKVQYMYEIFILIRES